MTKQYFFAFSEGSYSDYGMNGLYVCDHEVSEDQWRAHLAAYERDVEIQRPKNPPHWSNAVIYTAWHNSEESKAFRKWVEDNDPEKTFQELHGMVKIEYEEFWRDN